MNSDAADKKFSELIRKRDPVCVRCRWRASTDCSHYFERGHSSVRYDPRNGDGLCRQCHQIWEGRKNGYREYKIKQLGKKEYESLEKLSNTIMKRDEAIAKFIELYA